MINPFKKKPITLSDTLSTVLNLSEINIIYSQVSKDKDHKYYLTIRFTVKNSNEIKSAEIGYNTEQEACFSDQKKIFDI